MSSRLIKLLCKEYKAPDLTTGDLHLIKQGKYANAVVYQFQVGDTPLVVKEFYSRVWIIRVLYGRLMIAHEFKVLRALAGKPGIPTEVRKIGPYALAMQYLGDETVKSLCNNLQKLPKEFFVTLEQQVDAMHRAGYVHLDLRNMGNIIHDNAGQPHLIDFQTSVSTAYLPRKIRQFLEEIDRSGVYKNWGRLCEEALNNEQLDFIEHFKSYRRFWIFDGYWLYRKFKRLRNRIKDSFTHP